MKQMALGRLHCMKHDEDHLVNSESAHVFARLRWHGDHETSQALLNYDTLDAETKSLVDERMKGYKDPQEMAPTSNPEGFHPNI